MKFTKLFIASVVALAAAGMAACSGSDKAAENVVDADSVAVLTVDQVLADPAALAGDTITVEGLCSHLCKHGGTKAFLANPDTTAQVKMLMCVATDAIGGAFDPSCPDKTLTVEGVVTPNTVTLSEVNAMAAKQVAEEEAGHCDAEAKSGNKVLNLKEQMDSMVAANPADTIITIGYYIETLSYGLPQE